MAQSTDPSWLKRARSYLGLAEVPGKTHNGKILGWWKLLGAVIRDDETPWCSAFVNWCMDRAGVKGTTSARARSWANWGVECPPKLGCVVVMSRGSNPMQGHVGFLVSVHGNQVIVLGGNQGDRVCEATFPADRVIAYRWPKVGDFKI